MGFSDDGACIIVNEFVVNGKPIIQFANLSDVLRKIITLLGSACMKIYNISPQIASS